MDPSPSLCNRALTALAGVAIDSLRDLTVAQVDQVAGKLHHRLSSASPESPAPPETTATVAAKPKGDGGGQTTNTRALLMGAAVGMAVALLIDTRD